MSGNFFVFKLLEGKFNENTFSRNVNLTEIHIIRKQCLHQWVVELESVLRGRQMHLHQLCFNISNKGRRLLSVFTSMQLCHQMQGTSCSIWVCPSFLSQGAFTIGVVGCEFGFCAFSYGSNCYEYVSFETTHGLVECPCTSDIRMHI